MDPLHFVCHPNTTSNQITCKSCNTETLCTEMHLGFHAVFVIYVWQSQNWVGLKTAGKILQYQIPYRNVEQCFSCIHTKRWRDTMILISMPTNKIVCVNLGRISVTFTILVSWFYCYMGQFYSQTSLTSGATTKIKRSALTDSAQPMTCHWLLSQEITDMFHSVRRYTVYFSPCGEMAPPVHKIQIIIKKG